MTAFSTACDALFADVNLARDAVWRDCSGGVVMPCRVILARPDVQEGFGQSQLVSETLRIDVRVAQIAAPRRGDRIEIGGEVFLLQGEPRRDRLRLVWQCEAIPE